MLGCCTINIGRLTSLVDSSVNLAMSLVSHGSLYIHLVDLICMLRLFVDMDDILVLCMIDCCMTTHLLLNCMLLVYVGHIYPLISNSLVSVDYVSFVVVIDI